MNTRWNAGGQPERDTWADSPLRMLRKAPVTQRASEAYPSSQTESAEETES